MLKKREVCSSPGLKRLNYFSGQVLTADDLRAEQDYCQMKFRQYNRAVFGCGILQGLEVSCSKHRVSVTPGIAVDTTGRLLELSEACNFDLPKDKGVWDLFIEFFEEPCDPLPTIFQGCNADNGNSFSRIQEAVKVWIVEASGKNEEKVAADGVWLGRIQSRKGQCQVKIRSSGKGRQTT